MSRSSAAAPRWPRRKLTERVCYGLELDPKYADVVVERWQALTGKKATLEGDGRTFDVIRQDDARLAA